MRKQQLLFFVCSSRDAFSILFFPFSSLSFVSNGETRRPLSLLLGLC